MRGLHPPKLCDSRRLCQTCEVGGAEGRGGQKAGQLHAESLGVWPTSEKVCSGCQKVAGGCRVLVLSVREQGLCVCGPCTDITVTGENEQVGVGNPLPVSSKLLSEI